MPLATRRDQFGRPIYSDPNQEGRPDDPLAPLYQPTELTKQREQVDPAVAAIGMPQERKSNIDYSFFDRQRQRITGQGASATANAQQASLDAMQRRLQNITQQGQNYAPVGEDATDLRSRLVSTVASYQGTPYKWGGAKPGGFDCSGLVQYAYSRLGISMPRVSGQQAHMGVRMPINQLRPGDLVAKPGHIAVYAGNGMMWEAPHTGAVVRLVPVRSNMYGVHLTLPGDSRA